MSRDDRGTSSYLCASSPPHTATAHPSDGYTAICSTNSSMQTRSVSSDHMISTASVTRSASSAAWPSSCIFGLEAVAPVSMQYGTSLYGLFRPRIVAKETAAIEIIAHTSRTQLTTYSCGIVRSPYEYGPVVRCQHKKQRRRHSARVHFWACTCSLLCVSLRKGTSREQWTHTRAHEHARAHENKHGCTQKYNNLP